MWIEPVFNRTQDDVDYAKANYSLDLPEQFKAAQNYSDWNRLIGNMHHLAELLKDHGHTIELSTREFGRYTVAEWNALGRTVTAIDARNRTASTYYEDQNIGRYRLGDIPFTHEIQMVQDDLGKLRYALFAMMNYTVAEWESKGQAVAEINARGRTAQEFYSRLPVPRLPYTHFQKINDIEEITLALRNIIDSIKHLYRVSGTFQSGQLSYLPRFVEYEIPEPEFMTVAEFNALRRTVLEIRAEERTAADFFRRL